MEKENEKRKGRLLKVTILRFVMLTLILVIGICIIVSHLIRNENLKIYRDFSRSYARMAAKNVDSDRIPDYLMTGETDEYYMQVDKLLNSMVDVSDLRYLYIYIPEEEGIRYLWDAQSDDDSRPLLDIWYYSGNFPKEDAFETYSGGNDHFTVYQYGSLNLAAYMTPLYDKSGKVLAVCEADIIMPRIEMVFPTVMVRILTWVLIMLVVLMIIFMHLTRRSIITPLEKINDVALHIVDNLETAEDIELDIHTGDEIETLARSIEKMNRALKEYLHENEKITAEKERVNTELDLAARIQSDMLPNIFPAFPERSEFNIYASMTPAKEVGGDFYDFFFIDHDHLAIIIADVSGKGVPAAMFMMMTKSMLQTRTISVQNPSQVLQDVNNMIFSNNKEKMFVTVWLGVLDLTTGLLTASNAGHESPYIKEPDGDFEIFKSRHGFVMGGLKNMKYTNNEHMLKPGSKIFVYTDGVPEAKRNDNSFFGLERTGEALNRAKDSSPEEILKEVENSVNSFAGDAEQFDDLTMLCLEYLGNT